MVSLVVLAVVVLIHLVLVVQELADKETLAVQVRLPMATQAVAVEKMPQAAMLMVE
jgi:hypothetical protein